MYMYLYVIRESLASFVSYCTIGGESKDVSDIITVGNVRGKRLPVKVLKQWKEGIQVSIHVHVILWSSLY